MQGEEAHWLDEVQAATAEWREETLRGETTPRTQAAHTAVEAAEVADVIVKAETYSEKHELATSEAAVELGDVVVAHLGTVEMFGWRASDLCRGSHAENCDDALDNAIRLQYHAVKLSAVADRDMDRDGARERYAAAVMDLAEKMASQLGVTLEECVDAALEKNGAREWEDWTAGEYKDA
jgi:hypothetical protein